MEHEVYVPFAAEAVRAALAEPERVARCVSGFQPDTAEAGPGGEVALRGRLKVRIGGSSITYRGSLRLTREEGGGAGEGDGGGTYTVRAEGGEARGEGSVELTLTAATRPADDGEGTVLVCTAELRGEGRITEFEERQRHTAGRRLLDRFGGELAAGLAADPIGPGTAAGAAGTAAAPGGIGEPDDNEPVIPGIPAPETPASAEARDRAAARAGEPEEPEKSGEPHGPSAGARTEKPGDERPGDGTTDGTGETEKGVFEVEIPPPALEPAGDEEFDGGIGDDLAAGAGDGLEDLDETDGLDGIEDLDEGPRHAAEAAHARRTMIGRSAEEVDHAPPRGRYAPVPPPQDTPSAAAVLRWAAPAAALVVASAVVVGRVLRRRR
ncbi:hypothetical protein CUT44_15810 [Streptomyces carminius]|uniref:Carbon monoxide dehydrogenase n=1 Tax=Streptomyces carminius TaxID=2665496 RepID=A0A2M8LXT7_9ACTN|nr:hypothetical protein [Streptomyces carminius]PJE96787.1 hypothetical protein CUT44_15810 [Streptomyces carminius]